MYYFIIKILFYIAEFGTKVGILAGHTNPICNITFAVNTKRSLTISDSELLLWDMQNFIVLKQLILNDIPSLKMVSVTKN